MPTGHYGLREGADPLARVTLSHLMHNIDHTFCAIENERRDGKDVNPLLEILRTNLYSLKLRLAGIGVSIEIYGE